MLHRNDEKRRTRSLTRFDGAKLFLLRSGKWLVILLILMIVTFSMVLGVAVVDGVSMEPGLKNGSLVLYVRHFSGPQPGDLVVARVASRERYVKRVIAGGGDRVDLNGGIVYINGVPEESSYLAEGMLTEDAPGGIEFPETLHGDAYMLLGDNRSYSVDSREFGAVERNQLEGKVIAVIRMP